MANKMIVDASHPEETRVVVLRGNRVEEFDFESASKRPLRGNIYLAKVTRVEPSLQAAFVDYGGNRHGFLAFSEIHPDYYQIPVADRQALLEEEALSQREEDEEANGERRSRRHRRPRRPEVEARVETAETISEFCVCRRTWLGRTRAGVILAELRRGLGRGWRRGCAVSDNLGRDRRRFDPRVQRRRRTFGRGVATRESKTLRAGQCSGRGAG